MITKTYKTQLNLNNTPFQDCEKSGLLFFDIETTGFTARTSSLYLIGAVSYQAPDWQVIQWLAESPQEESVILQAFLSFASGYSQLIHFNGDRFDLPYLADKCRAYGLPNTISALISRDLYRMIKPLKTLLSLPALRQKNLEEYLGLYREDRYNGGELIAVYREYVKVPSADLLHLLLLHNYEDLLGMLSIMPMLSYLALISGSYRASGCEMDGDALIIHAWLPSVLAQPFSYRSDIFYLSASQNRLAFHVKGVRKALKHFFSDYKNYYYLPIEDTAIHKSIAAYVDKDYREPAKASTCFSKKEGFYLPQKTALFEPVFKESYHDSLMYFPCTDSFLNDRSALQSYLVHLMSTI